MSRLLLAGIFSLTCIAALAQADDVQFQFGALYAENIQGVGLYAGLEDAAFTPYAAGYIDATLLVSESYDRNNPFFGGVSVGMRSYIPLAFAPYLGLGAYLGENEYEARADKDGIDNDKDGMVDERGETRTDNNLMAAFYPEAGWQLKLGNSFSVRVLGRYMLSSFGRKQDDWFYGVSFAVHSE